MPQIGLIELDQKKAYMLPYAPAIEVPPGAELVFLSGVTAIGPTADSASEDVREQTLALLANAASVLASAGTDWSHVIHIYEFVTDMREADVVHAAMGEYFIGNAVDSKPANTLIGVNALEHEELRVAFDVIAVRPVPGGDRVAPMRATVGDVAGGIANGISVRTDGTTFWMSGATAIPLYHHHPHVDEECVLPDDIREQTRRILATFDEVLAHLGIGWSEMVRMNQFLTDMRDVDAVREEIERHLAGKDAAFSTVVVGINALSAPGARLELELIASATPQ